MFDFNTLLDKCQMKKLDNLHTANFLKDHISESAYHNTMHCGNYLTFLSSVESKDFLTMKKNSTSDLTTGGVLSKTRLETGFFCKQSLCPACAWRKSVKNAKKIACVCQHAINQRYKILFITLTTPNVSSDKLSDEITKQKNAFNHLIKLKKYDFFKGIIKKLEITYNKKEDTYHPHLHLLVFVKPKYFKNGYITHETLLNDWRRCTKNDNVKIVDIRMFKTLEGKSEIESIMEIAKYASKSSDYNTNQNVFDVFYKALKGRNTLTYLRNAQKYSLKYNNGSLNHIKEEHKDSTVYITRIYAKYFKSILGYSVDKIEDIAPQLFDDDAEGVQAD